MKATDLLEQSTPWVQRGLPAPEAISQRQTAVSPPGGAGSWTMFGQVHTVPPLAAMFLGVVVAIVLTAAVVRFVVGPPGGSRTATNSVPPVGALRCEEVAQVNLCDWPDGARLWLSWYEKNKEWAGAPLWADQRWREFASCAAFANTIVCLNVQEASKLKDRHWLLVPVLLGNEAMARWHYPPSSNGQRGEAVDALLAQEELEGTRDTWYAYGPLASAVVIAGNTARQCFQRVCLEWSPPTTNNPGAVKLLPLGKMAVEERWP